ncbi:hypothetical protein [Streptobacillus canis]|uniref:hypothetical protein n=1 Tax=Streptobacillus canis TaxID=2678686 RepID=UPI0012E13D13|nr:hypothetical protein [Streptobacillus canis]
MGYIINESNYDIIELNDEKNVEIFCRYENAKYAIEFINKYDINCDVIILMSYEKEYSKEEKENIKKLKKISKNYKEVVDKMENLPFLIFKIMILIFLFFIIFILITDIIFEYYNVYTKIALFMLEK